MIARRWKQILFVLIGLFVTIYVVEALIVWDVGEQVTLWNGQKETLGLWGWVKSGFWEALNSIIFLVPGTLIAFATDSLFVRRKPSLHWIMRILLGLAVALVVTAIIYLSLALILGLLWSAGND
jgi:hypothetical protein